MRRPESSRRTRFHSQYGRPAQVSGDLIALNPGLGQPVGVQLARAEPGTGGEPTEEARIASLAGAGRDDRGLPLLIASNCEDDCCLFGDEIGGVERLDDHDVAPAGAPAPNAHGESRRAAQDSIRAQALLANRRPHGAVSLQLAQGSSPGDGAVRHRHPHALSGKRTTREPSNGREYKCAIEADPAGQGTG